MWHGAERSLWRKQGRGDLHDAVSAVELARYKVTANSILPGHIETAMTEEPYKGERFSGAIMPRIPARRWGTGEDFAGIAIYLMSDTSACHTADKFLIDGGFFYF